MISAKFFSPGNALPYLKKLCAGTQMYVIPDLLKTFASDRSGSNGSAPWTFYTLEKLEVTHNCSLGDVERE